MRPEVRLHAEIDAGGFHVLKTPLACFPLRFRSGSSDPSVFAQVFVNREYACVDDIGEPSLIVDCGANVGYTAAYFLTKWPNAKLIAIEPDDGNAEILRHNLNPYGVFGVKSSALVISDSSSSAQIVAGAVWSKRSRLMMVNEAYRDGREWTRQVRECRPEEEHYVVAWDMNDLIAISGYDRISLLKMDIEGAEAVVFSENLDWLDRVDNIVIELHDDSTFGNASDVFHRAIAGRGFVVTRCGELTVCKREK